MADNNRIEAKHLKRVYVRMQPDFYDHIGRATYQLDLSISDIVRRAVKDYLKKHKVR